MGQKHEPYLVVGLGNPGREHQGNRHNVGFMVLDQVAKELGIEFRKIKMDALLTRGRFGDEKVFLAKPQTYMNNSGRAVRSLMQFYKLPLDHLLVVYDDVDLPFEALRLRPGGGAGGQKGVRSIIRALGSEEFARLRVGIGRPPGRMSVSSYVLTDFSGQEGEALPFVIDDAAQAVLTFVRDGLDQAMTLFNRMPNDE